MDSMILLVAMIAVFYFLIIRPENKRKKQAEDMRNSLKRASASPPSAVWSAVSFR